MRLRGVEPPLVQHHGADRAAQDAGAGELRQGPGPGLAPALVDPDLLLGVPDPDLHAGYAPGLPAPHAFVFSAFDPRLWSVPRVGTTPRLCGTNRDL